MILRAEDGQKKNWNIMEKDRSKKSNKSEVDRNRREWEEVEI
jgi:hypothetical protein